MAVATLAAYMLDNPRVPPNGGTWLGYTLGTLAALLVIFLSLFGIRKRVYRFNVGTAIGWVSAHVYLGLAALLVATLHSGMRFGLNVHTLAYVLMCFVTASGVWGMYAYMRYPGVVSAGRGHQERRETLKQIAELDERALEVAGSTAQIRELIADSIRRTDLGRPGLWQALGGHDESALLLAGQPNQPVHLLPNPGHRVLMEILAQLRVGNRDPQMRSRLQSLVELTGQKSVLLERLRKETRLAALLRIWLYIHVPLCCALLAALVAHVLTVFYYW